MKKSIIVFQLHSLRVIDGVRYYSCNHALQCTLQERGHTKDDHHNTLRGDSALLKIILENKTETSKRYEMCKQFVFFIWDDNFKIKLWNGNL